MLNHLVFVMSRYCRYTYTIDCIIPAPRGEGRGEFIGRLVPVIHHFSVRMPLLLPLPLPLWCCGRQCVICRPVCSCCRDAALSYDQRSVLAGPLVGPARRGPFGPVVVTLKVASMIFTGKQEGILWPSPRGAGPAKRSCSKIHKRFI